RLANSGLCKPKLGRSHLRFATSLVATSASRRKSCPCAFTDQLPLELRQRGEDAEDQLPRWCGGVDSGSLAGKDLEADATRGEILCSRGGADCDRGSQASTRRGVRFIGAIRACYLLARAGVPAPCLDQVIDLVAHPTGFEPVTSAFGAPSFTGYRAHFRAKSPQKGAEQNDNMH